MGQSKSRDNLRDKKIAERIIDKLIRENPNDNSLYIKRGELKLLMDDYEGAINNGLRVINTDMNNFSGYELLASAYQKLEKWDKAISSMKKMQELQPDRSMITYNLAVL